MFETVHESWKLFKQSLGVLSKDKELIVFPILSVIATLVLFGLLLFPFLASTGISETAGWAVFGIFYFVASFISIFFNTALIGAALKRLRGEDPTISDGLHIAFSKIGSIFVWSLISATVGLVLRALANKSRDNLIGSLVVRFMGAGWSLATFFVIPVLVIENKDPLAALGRSVEIVKKKWGTAVTAGAGIGLISFLLVLGIILGTIGITMVLPGLLLFIAIPAVFLIALVVLLSGTVEAILVAALYHYATQDAHPTGFDPKTVGRAFR